jgi:hypothetical protein
MILTMIEMYAMRQGRYSILSYLDKSWWVMEREYVSNLPNISSVPRGLYTLESHSTKKYPHTWALIGLTVSHGPMVGIPRYACVLHRGTYPIDLQGCLTVCKSISPTGYAIESMTAMGEFRALLSTASEPIQLLMQ